MGAGLCVGRFDSPLALIGRYRVFEVPRRFMWEDLSMAFGRRLRLACRMLLYTYRTNATQNELFNRVFETVLLEAVKGASDCASSKLIVFKSMWSNILRFEHALVRIRYQGVELTGKDAWPIAALHNLNAVCLALHVMSKMVQRRTPQCTV